ncbi:unnamed protein product [Allacma fusca]|uniref:F-box domain-containing protein n=1 Tax=Allacma fusca TaxID=39272 RepID=A0A8J2KCA1_9HEXA|nr:unnamed protein product [Allacma fusca]
MFRPIILFFTANSKEKNYACDYAAVATDEEPLPAHLHPMLFPGIISKICSYLPTQDLVNSRLICHAWNTEAVPILQKRIHHLKVYPRKMRDFLRTFRRSHDLPVQSFTFYADHSEHMLLMDTVTETIPHCIVSLKLKIAGQELPNVSKILQNLRWLKDLSIFRIPEKCLPPSYRKYETLEEDLNLPFLTSICFGNTNPALPFICNYDNFITDIINGAENLVNLEFQNWKSSLQQVLRFAELPRTLERLSLNGVSVKESEVATLKKKNLSLKHLTITLGSSIRDVTLSGFFQSLENSLEILEIICEKPHSNFPVHCQLPYLKVLRFQGWRCGVTLDNFTVYFPALEHIALLDFQFIGFTDYRDPTRSESLVRTVVAQPYEGDELAEMNIASLVTAFPKTIRFKGYHFTDGMCDVIFKYWPQLQFLCLEQCKNVSDFGLTGIPVTALWSENETTPPLACRCDDQLRAAQSRMNFHIGNLQELKYLYLKGKGFVTNASLHYGILHLKYLTELELPGDEIPWCVECIAKINTLRTFYTRSVGEAMSDHDIIFLKDKIPALNTIYSYAQCKL